VIKWQEVLKAKTKRQQDLSTWTDEEWGSQEQHRAKAKGKKHLLKQKEDICQKQHIKKLLKRL